MLLTRSPLSPAPKGWFSLDLHVLSAPPAFVLSQDQTLREDLLRRRKANAIFKVGFELKVFLPKKGDGFIVTSQAKAGEVLDVYAVEFSKTAPRAGYSRKRPPLMEALGKK